MNRKQRRQAAKQGKHIEKEPVYLMKPSDIKNAVIKGTGQKALEHYIHQQCLSLDKEFTLDDFSHEHLEDYPKWLLSQVILEINKNRDDFNKTKDKDYWWQMIQLLPSSYNQKRTVQLNYEVLNTMYHARKNHKLDEWHTLCDEIEKLPYSEFITMKFNGDKTNE